MGIFQKNETKNRRKMKSQTVHEFISPDGHPTKCFGLRGEIQIHTQQTNKLCLYQDSCSDYSRIYHRILEIGMEFSKLLDSVEISLVAQGVRSYVFFVFNVDVARTCLEFIASKANKTDHFKKHVKKGIFNYSRFVQAYYLMRNKVPNFSIDSLFIHPKMSFYTTIFVAITTTSISRPSPRKHVLDRR